MEIDRHRLKHLIEEYSEIFLYVPVNITNFYIAATCPADTGIGICVVSPNQCSSDGECHIGQKCCQVGCNRECIYVV